MKHILVQNNQIVGNPQDLPINAENISNFYLLPPYERKMSGGSKWKLEIFSAFIGKSCGIPTTELFSTRMYFMIIPY